MRVVGSRKGLSIWAALAIVLAGGVGAAGARPATVSVAPLTASTLSLSLPSVAPSLVPVPELGPVIPAPPAGGLPSLGPTPDVPVRVPPVGPTPDVPVRVPPVGGAPDASVEAPSVGATPGVSVQAPSTTAVPTGSGGVAAVSPSQSGSPSGSTSAGRRASIARRAASTPAERRRAQRRRWETPLRAERLRRLRETVVERQGCLDGLSDQGRQTLILRAGLLGHRPASRRTIARRLGISLRRELRLERSSLRGLTRAGAGGLCDGGAVAVGSAVADGAAHLGGSGSDELGSALSGAAREPAADGAPGESDPKPAGDVLGDTYQGSGLRLDLEDGLEAAPEALPFLVLLLVGSLAAALLAARRLIDERAALAAASAERPLLFLDVDGVIALDPWIADLPPDLRYLRGLGASYVPDRAGELICKLADHFDVVWATGWEQEANTRVRDVLGLEDELPVLRFGKKAVHGSSEWKIQLVDRYARHRPAAWIDDNLCGDHEEWAERRPEPTLLVPTDPHVGICPEDVERLIDWADSLTRAEAGSRNGG